MKIVIFGATGGTGRSIVEQALAEGHILTLPRLKAGEFFLHP